MDSITMKICTLLQSTEIDQKTALLQQAKLAFLDYLAAALAGAKEPAVKAVADLLEERPGAIKLLGQNFATTPENAAFYLGFASHYLDYDDAQADIMGHMSTVIFSALLPLVDKNTKASDFFSAYVAGSELEAILGSLLNPAHKRKGYHPTATLGNIGAAAAIARLKRLTLEQTAELLSLGATQAAGLGIEAGTDTKPLHAGFAARNAVFAYLLISRAGLTSSLKAFNNEDGWLKVVGDKALTEAELERLWLKPGRLIKPGLWMKEHCYCSAAITGIAACKQLFTEGYSLDKLDKVIFHFPPGADYSLHYSLPDTGQEGRFSIEYPAWMTLTQGDVDDSLFYLARPPEQFYQDVNKFVRQGDLPKVAQDVRIIEVEAFTKEGAKMRVSVPDPPGSPARPFTQQELRQKLAGASTEQYAEQALETVFSERCCSMAKILELI